VLFFRFENVTLISISPVEDQTNSLIKTTHLFIVKIKHIKAMTNKSLIMMILMVFAFSFVNAQDESQKRELPAKHRGMHPRLQADGTVVDDNGKPLGSIKNGKVCDVSGKVIGVISGHGDVTTSSGKKVGAIQKDGSYKSMKGHVVTTDSDGVVKVSGKEVAKVEAGYKDKSHGCALHCFFSSENLDAGEVDHAHP
jgi:hypothetical protein